jgi:hypothetical protein
VEDDLGLERGVQKLCHLQNEAGVLDQRFLYARSFSGS